MAWMPPLAGSVAVCTASAEVKAMAARTRNREDEAALVKELLAGNEDAFVTLVREHQRLFLHIARGLVGQSLAEELVQESWLAVIEALPRFEGRSSIRTWMTRILVFRGNNRRKKERRSIPMSAFGDGEAAVEPERFDPEGHWTRPPASWGSSPETVVMDREFQTLLQEAMERLPENQRLVLQMRDVAQLDAREVCDALNISEANQRVLLHRARSKVRAAIAAKLEG